MRFVIKHEIKGRLRVHILQSRMSFAQADTLQYYLDGQKNIVSAKIQERTLDVTVVYTGSREEALKTLENFTYQGTEVPENYLANSVMCSPPISYSPRKSQSTSLSGCEFSGAGKDALIWGSLCAMPAVSPERKSGNACFRLFSTASTICFTKSSSRSLVSR